MAFDLRSRIRLGVIPWQTQQFAEGDANAWNNCVPTSIELGLASYGLPTVNPQFVTSAVYGAGYVGGEDLSAVLAYVGAHEAAPPTTSGGPDRLTIDQLGQQAAYVIGFFNCDANATITCGPGGFYHASPIVAYDGSTWTVLNVHDGSYPQFSDADLDAAMGGSGGFFAFTQPLPEDVPLTADEHNMLQDAHDKISQMWTDFIQGPRNTGTLPVELTSIKAELDTLSQHSDPTVAEAVARIEAALKQA